MKKWIANVTCVVALAFLLSTTAFAKDKDSGNFYLDHAAKVGSAELQPGHYKADWKPMAGNNVEVNILRHGKTIATTQAEVKQLPKASNQDAVVTRPSANNNNKVLEIDFSGNQEALIFGSTS